MPLNLVFKALSDGSRREILHMLQKGDMTAGEIAEQFRISKPSISHHLNILKQARLVQDIRQGQNIVYSLNTTVFQEVIGWLYDILGTPGDGDMPDKTDALEVDEIYPAKEGANND